MKNNSSEAQTKDKSYTNNALSLTRKPLAKDVQRQHCVVY